MARITVWRRLNGWAKASLVIGTLLLISALSNGGWVQALIALGLLSAGGWALYSTATALNSTREPWPWPPEFREQAESMGRSVDPTPRRLLPPTEKTSLVAKVASTDAELTTLLAEKSNAWPWAVFASVLVQRRNAVTHRLRKCVSGYQPRPRQAPLTGAAYAPIALHAIRTITDLVGQVDQFMRSPAFTGAFGDVGDESTADAAAILAVGHRLMDYHESFLDQAELCLQTPVHSEALVFVQDMGAYMLCPLVGYEEFIAAMCATIGEAQEVLPYADPRSTVWFDDVNLTMDLPEDLANRTMAHFNRFAH